MNVYGPNVLTAIGLVLALAAPPAVAGAAGEDTMIVVEQDALPEDIINVIRLPDAARERAGGAAPNGSRGVGNEVADQARGGEGDADGAAAASAREAAADIAEQARNRGAEIAAEARERAADIANAMREAAEEMREEVSPPAGPPTDLDLPEQAEGPP